jgi:hypothetical protein
MAAASTGAYAIRRHYPHPPGRRMPNGSPSTSFAAYLLTACWSAARPVASSTPLRWDDLDFRAEALRVERQYNAKLGKLTPPKHDSRRTVALTTPVNARLAELPRESEWVFTTIRGTHYTPRSRVFHWNRVRSAVGIGNTSL